jgi:hypothetical protein
MKEQYQIDVYFLMQLGSIQAGPFYTYHDALVAKNRLNPYSSHPESGMRIMKTTMTMVAADD